MNFTWLSLINYLSCRLIRLQLILAPFKDYKQHPGHFEIEVPDTTTINGLKIHVQCHLGEAVETVALFKEPSCSKESYLVPSWCLEHCGMVGGSRVVPTSGRVYYDYVPAVNDCPILMDDSHIPFMTQTYKGRSDSKTWQSCIIIINYIPLYRDNVINIVIIIIDNYYYQNELFLRHYLFQTVLCVSLLLIIITLKVYYKGGHININQVHALSLWNIAGHWIDSAE